MSAHHQGDERGLNDVFGALRHHTRRHVLKAVARTNQRRSDELAVEELGAASDDVELVQSALYHHHLPRLGAAGFVEWDAEKGTVTRGPRFEAIQPLVRFIEAHEEALADDWP